MSAKKPAGKSLDEFVAAHDPRHVVDNPLEIYGATLPRASVYVVTAAQNATPVHPEFWAILSYISEVRRAHRSVIPLRYKNPTSKWSGSQKNEEYWDEAVKPFLCNQRHHLNSNLTLLADIKIQPTASSPLTGAEAISLASSGIIGHTKIHTRSIATPQSAMAKLMMTSGACTVENYTDSRAGRIGEFHHSISAVLVEVVNGKRFHLRRLHYDAKTKSVTDLGIRYFKNRHERAPRALGLVMGDTHVDYVDPDVVRATFGENGIVKTCRPERLVWHDLLDGYSCNHHHGKNAFNRIAKRRAGADNVEAEVQRAIEFVRTYTPGDTESYVVASNHDDFLRQWVVNNDWREDPTNAVFYLKTALAMAEATQLGKFGTEYPSPFPYWFERANVPRARCLRNDESLLIGGIECCYHFDKGPDGARGSIKNMRRIGVKTAGAHKHAPGEDEGASQAGTSTRLKAEYTSGPSSWLNAHVMINADGKRQLLVIVNGDYRA